MAVSSRQLGGLFALSLFVQSPAESSPAAAAETPSVLRGRSRILSSGAAASPTDGSSTGATSSVEVQTYRSAATGPQCGALRSMQLPIFSRWEQCVDDGIAQSDLGIPGIVPHIKAHCWCHHGLRQTISEMGCCGHDDFAQLCDVECTPNCRSDEAQHCLKECPALCFEPQYASAGCAEACASGRCHRFMRCATTAAANATAAGTSARVCHERDFVSSPQVDEYLRCRVEQSHRSAWHKHVAATFCACKSQLAIAAQNAHCCGAGWSQELCSRSCGGIDCASTEATSCAASCGQLCKHSSDTVSGPCYELCFRPGSQCFAYAECQDQSAAAFDYVCDDGAAPLASGCCVPIGGHESDLQCPATCDHSQVHRAVATASPGLYIAQAVGNRECTCSGCPATEEEASMKLESLIRDEVHSDGVKLLAAVAHAEGLRWPTQEMQRLMDERNEAIVKDLDGRSGSVQRYHAIQAANRIYIPRLEAASRQAAHGNTTGDTPVEDPAADPHFINPDVMFALLIFLTLVVFLLGVGFSWAIMTRRVTKVVTIDISAQNQPEHGSPSKVVSTAYIQPHRTVVFGQPVGPRSAATPDPDTTADSHVVQGFPDLENDDAELLS
eukprot:TRINITY_DN41710_c0_g1_i1.p1 TRINITY_DN41710_c0_g1~~TRINITY_DN41710_c0_g1_i1.p1  ORF type:complete len:612 (+),score=77.95 TRINITY_DN41710_c0_g1_i1:73-1908(+)